MIVPFPTAETPPQEIADLREREAALDIASSCIVEAPAGSGKTGLLIQRFLKLLGTVDDPAEVLALTFTTKATAEMVERVLKALRTASIATEAPKDEFALLTHRLAQAVLQRDRERDWRILDRPHLLNIRTIDSLCALIVQSLPITSGGMSSVSPVADPRPFYLQAAHAVMMRFGGGDPVLDAAIETVLLHRDGDLPFCERILAEMLATRDQWGSLIPLGERLTEEHLENVTLPRLNASLRRTIEAALTEACEGFEDSTLDEIARIAERHAFEPGYKDEPNPLLPCAGRQNRPGSTVEDLQHWQALARLMLKADGFRAAFSVNHIGTKLFKDDADRLKAIFEDIACDELFRRVDAVRAFAPEATYPEDQWRVSKALFRLLEHALVELKLLFAREEVCDFTEIALSARAALQTQENGLLEVFGTRLHHLLVDEMQDTSAGQYDLLEQLTAGWDGRSQTVFLVGDPKQSIYLFRQARVDRFQNCMSDARLGDIPLQVLPLTTNFRSGGHLVSQFNETFRAIFPADHPADGDVVFHDATAANPAQPGEGMDWTIEAVPTSSDLSENRRNRRFAIRREARETVAVVKAARAAWQQERQRRIDAGSTKDFPFKAAVLTRARNHVIEIAKQLERAGIPYRAVDLKPLAEQQEVLDLVTITRALLHPADRIAWLALLRAPWCGIELVHLHTLAAGDRPEHRKESLHHRLRERAGNLPENAKTRVLRTLDVLDGALRHTGTESLADRVERTWRSLGADLYLTPTERENAADYLRVLDAMESEGEAFTLPHLNRRLDRLFARSGNAPDAIDIMTIHRAKGLEWDTVIVPGLHRVPTRDTYSALEWLELPTRGEDGSGDVLMAPLPGKGGEPGALLNFIRTRKRARTYAEIKRLFYVAVTRARTSLHLFATPELSQKGEIINRAGTLMKAAWPAAQNYVVIPVVTEAEKSEEAEAETLALAAAAEVIPFPAPAAREVRLPNLQRLPSDIHAVERLRATTPPGANTTPAAQPFARAAGTFGARAVGNAIHAFVDRLSNELAARIVTGETITEAAHFLLHAVQSWQPAIRTTLRAGSLPPSVVERASATVLRALTATLQSQEGRWILTPHTAASGESAWHTGAAGSETRIRLDRSFFAGREPNLPGDDIFWIIDFKTGDRTGPNETEATRNAYLQEERAAYEAQLRTYAEVRRLTLPAGTPIHLALFYPLMDRLIWWPYESTTETLTPVATDIAESEPDTDGQYSLFG